MSRFNLKEYELRWQLTLTGDVHNVADYLPIRTWTVAAGAGMDGFNASLAFLSAMQVDRVYGTTQVNNFLSSNELAIDVTPEQQKTLSCEQLDYETTGAKCARTVFMPVAAPLELITAVYHSEASILTAYEMQGYVLTFGPGEGEQAWRFDQKQDCETLGRAEGAVRLCIRNTAANSVQAHLARADVSYHRANASIASHTPLKDRRASLIDATELLSAFNIYTQGSGAFSHLLTQWLTNRTTSTSTVDTGDSGAATISSVVDAIASAAANPTRKRQAIGSLPLDFSSLSSSTADIGMNPLLPIIPFTMLETCFHLGDPSSKLASYCTNFLHNFLAIPLYWCDNLIPIRATMGQGLVDFTDMAQDTATAEILESFMHSRGLDTATAQRLIEETPDSEVAIARLQYLVRVGQTSLLAYCIVTGAVLLICALALIWGSSVGAETGDLPLWDFVTLLEVQNYNGDLRDARARCVQPDLIVEGR
ncbi:hypothetical protein LTR95_004233 [Oleoguttula sp. CCFEE 5521]